MHATISIFNFKNFMLFITKFIKLKPIVKFKKFELHNRANLFGVTLKFFTHLSFSENFSRTAGNFQLKFYTPILCLYLGKMTKNYLINSNFDKVMPY